MAQVRLIGHEISHSASPAMQNAAFESLGLSHVYQLADVPTSRLRSTVEGLRDPSFLGANVTMPYKDRVAMLMDVVDEHGRAIGAVNTVVNRDGQLLGSNTDVPAMADELRLVRADPQRALILGAGGAGRAVRRALASIGVSDVAMLSRTGAEGTIPWSDKAREIEKADLLVNATPIGTAREATPVDASLFHDGLAVLDLVYRPSPTRLVREARARGLPARAGAGILLGQGWRSLEAWLGESVSAATKRVMADALSAELGEGADV